MLLDDGKRPEPILMSVKSGKICIFRRKTRKEKIKKIVFHDLMFNLPPNAWDVSEERNQSVMAWESDGVLHICANGKVKANKNSSYLFDTYVNLESIEFGDNFDTSQVTDMSYMFLRCGNLKHIDVSKFDTSNVTNMRGMFWNCSNLKQLDISRFNTRNVTDMSWMFSWCVNLRQLDVSKLDTRNVTDMSFMFNNCNNVRQLDVSKFDTRNVTNMSYMFFGCETITKLEVNEFDISKVTNTKEMFSECRQITQIDLDKFDVNKVTSIQNAIQSPVQIEEEGCVLESKEKKKISKLLELIKKLFKRR